MICMAVLLSALGSIDRGDNGGIVELEYNLQTVANQGIQRTRGSAPLMPDVTMRKWKNEIIRK